MPIGADVIAGEQPARSGRPLEQGRAARLLSNFRIIPDGPSERALALQLTQRIEATDIQIFGTAGAIGIPTLSADRRFVDGARAQGLSLDVIIQKTTPLQGK